MCSSAIILILWDSCCCCAFCLAFILPLRLAGSSNPKRLIGDASGVKNSRTRCLSKTSRAICVFDVFSVVVLMCVRLLLRMYSVVNDVCGLIGGGFGLKSAHIVCLSESAVEYIYMYIYVVFIWCFRSLLHFFVSLVIFFFVSFRTRAVAVLLPCRYCLRAGVILDGLLAAPEGIEGRAFDLVIYIGDGGGDYCPALRLRYVRRWFSLCLFRKEARDNNVIQAPQKDRVEKHEHLLCVTPADAPARVLQGFCTPLRPDCMGSSSHGQRKTSVCPSLLGREVPAT